MFVFRSMPVLLTKIEGKGNGIKTVVPNMSDVARALSRPPSYPTKFFGCELGAQTTLDEKNDRYIVNGAHDATRLRELLDGFIDKFVLCASCKNPETDLIIDKTEVIIRDCKACGQRTKVDMRHKLTTYIVKNPPKINKKKKAKDGNATADNGAGTPPADDDADAASDDELTKRIKSEAADLNMSSQLDEWSADTSPEAVKARQANESGVPTKLLGAMTMGDDDSDDDANSPYSQIGRWAEENRGTASPIEVFKYAQDLGIEKKHKTVLVLVQALFTEKMVTEIKTYAALFTKARCSLILTALHSSNFIRR
jgi:translation initiation factor 5